MKNSCMFALVVLLLPGGVTLAHAQGRHSGRQVVDRLRAHEQRIEEGERSGELTRKEAATLREKEDFYRAKMDDFLRRNHGYLTDNEEDSLEHSLDAMSDQIYRNKHNGDVR